LTATKKNITDVSALLSHQINDIMLLHLIKTYCLPRLLNEQNASKLKQNNLPCLCDVFICRSNSAKLLQIS